MAEAPEMEFVNLTTGWGKLTLSLFLFIAAIGIASVSFTAYEHIRRSKEHEVMSCLIKLALYMQGQPPDKPVDWQKMPVDTFSCVPRFIYEREQIRSPK